MSHITDGSSLDGFLQITSIKDAMQGIFGTLKADDAIKSFKKLGVEGDDLTNILLACGMSADKIEEKLSKLGDKTKFVDKLKTGFKGLADILHTTPKNLLGWTGGITAAVAAVTLLSNVQKKMYENAQDGASVYKQSSSSIEEYKAQVETLKTSLASGTLSHQEAYNARQKLLAIQGEVASAYGTEAAGLDLLSMSATKAAAAFDKLTKARANEFLIGNNSVIDNAQKTLESIDEYRLANIWTGIGSPDKYGVIKQRIQGILSNYEHAFLDVKKDSFGNETTASIVIKANAEDAKDTIIGITSDIKKLKDEVALQGLDISDVMSINGLESTAESYIRTIDNAIDKYSEIYETANLAKIADSDNYSILMRDMEAAQQAYNDALSESYDSEQERAAAVASAFELMIAAKQKFTDTNFEGDLGVKDIFQELIDSFNAAMLNEEFRLDITATVNGETPGKFGKGITNYLDAFTDGGGFIDPYEVMNAGLTGKGKAWNDMTAQEQAYVNLKAALAYYNLEVEEGIDLLTQWGLIQTKTGKLSGDISNAYDAAARKTSDVVEAISEAQSILNSQKAGFSISVDDFDSAKVNEYSDALEYNNGVLQLNADKVNALIDVKAKEQIAHNNTQKALAQSKYIENSQEINKLRSEIKSLIDGQEDIKKNKEDLIDSYLKENEEIRDICLKYDLMTASIREATGAYQAWINAQNTPQSGDMFDSSQSMMDVIKKTFNDTTSEYYGRFNNADFKAAVDFVIPESVDSTDKTAVNTYLKKVGELFKVGGDGKTTVNFANFIRKATQAGLMVLDEASGEYKVAAGKTVDDFAKELLGGGVELTKAMMEAIFGEMEEFGDFFDFGDEAEKTLGDLAVSATEAKEALEALSGNEDLEIKIDITDIEGKEEQIAALDETISKMQEYKKLNLDASQVEYANDIIRYCIAQKNILSYQTILSVDASQIEGELGTAIELMQEYARLQGQLAEAVALGAETDGITKEIDGVVDKIKGLDKEHLIKLGIDPESLTSESLSEYLQGMNGPKILLDAGIKPEAISGLTKDIDADVKFGVNSDEVDEFKEQDHDLDAWVTYYKDSTDVDDYNPKNYTRYVTYESIDNTSGDHVLNGTAHMSGTAFASGDWGTAPGGITLTGELGKEIVVDPNTGKWYTVGDNGAEFVDIPSGAIVFNHKQSESLLKYGYVSGRGKSMASGTAMVTGGIPKDFVNNWLTGGPSNIGGESNSTDSSENKNNEKSPFEREYELKKHYLEMEQLVLKEFNDWLEDAYKQAFHNGQIEIEDFYKYEEEVFNNKKELFKDGLNDIEHEIDSLEREGGKESTIIAKYQSAIDKIQSQIQLARDRGLDDNDDYIQELMRQAWDYEDEIKDIQDEIIESSKDAIDDLVDYRIDMLKQEIEDEKDALGDKLDALKDFYDERKNAIKKAREEEKYLEEQTEKRDAVSSIKAELNRLRFDDSAKAEKRKLELEEELKKAEKELSDFEDDRAYEETIELLDKQSKAQEDQIQSEIDALDKKLNDPEALYNQALSDIKNNTYALYEEMVEYNNRHGSGNPEDIENMWLDADKTLDAYFNLFGQLYKGVSLFDITNPPKNDSGYDKISGTNASGYYNPAINGGSYVYESKDGKRYRVYTDYSGGMLNSNTPDFIRGFENQKYSVLSDLLSNTSGSITSISGQRSVRDISLSTGDIIIEGNANTATVSEIRRAQRENIDYVLREFYRLNK